MKVCILYAFPGSLIERMLVQGFTLLIGESNVSSVNVLEDFANRSFDIYDLLIICSSVALVGDFRSLTLSLMEKVRKQSSTKIAVCDFADDPRLIRLPNDLTRIPCFKLSPLDRIPNLESFKKILLFHLPVKTLAEQIGLWHEHWGIMKSLRLAQNVFPILPSYLQEPNFAPNGLKRYSISYIANMSLQDSIRVRIPTYIMERKRALAFTRAIKIPNSFVVMGDRHQSGLPLAVFLNVISVY